MIALCPTAIPSRIFSREFNFSDNINTGQTDNINTTLIPPLLTYLFQREKNTDFFVMKSTFLE